MNKKIKVLATIFFTCCYIFCVGLLVWQALTPGSESSNISQNFGDQLSNALTNITKPVVEKVAVSSVKINSVTINGEATQLKTDAENGYSYIDIAMGSTAKISAGVSPSNANNPALEYSVSNDKLTINQSGVISAISEGESRVIITSKENSTISCEFVVKISKVFAESIEIANPIENIYVGQTHLLKVNFNPQDTTDKNIVWFVSDESILSISESGLITALTAGSASITATCEQNSELTDSFEITVEPMPNANEPENQIVELNAISVSGESSLTLKRGDKITPEVAYSPADATYKGLNFYSTNDKVATVSQTGEISALTAGNCVITITSNTYSNISAQINVTVEERLTSVISLSISGASGLNNVVKVGKSATITAGIDDNATIKTVIYESSNQKVVTVSQDGVINALSAGTATITVYSTDGKTRVESKIEITVERVAFKDTISNFYYWVRKAFGHFGAFLVLGIVASFMFLCFSKAGIVNKAIWFGICMVSGFAVAGLTEIFQLPIFTAGRYCSFTDVLIDFTGYSVATVSIFILAFAYELIQIFRYKAMQKRSESK